MFPREQRYLADSSELQQKGAVAKLLKDVENLYISGSEADQLRAKQILEGVGYREALERIEQPAFNPNRPVVGGGGYVDVDNDLYSNECLARKMNVVGH